MKNAKNLSQELLKFKKGDVVITTKSYSLKDIDFKKSAMTWWGSNIASTLNIVKDKNEMVPKGTILFMFTEDRSMNDKSITATGYTGGTVNDRNEWHISKYINTYGYGNFYTQLMLISLLEGYAHIIPYKKLDCEIREKFEKDLKYERINRAIRNGTIVFLKDHNMEVTELIYKDGKHFIKGYDIKSRKKMNDIMIRSIDDLVFTKEDGTPFDGTPFEEDSTIKDNDYEYKEDSGGGRGTWVLLLGPNAWEKVKHLFDDSGRPDDNGIKRIPAGDFVWNLYAQSYTSDGKEMHKIYGTSGDYTFGNAPTYYQQRLRGNKKAAKKVFDWFITMYLQN